MKEQGALGVGTGPTPLPPGPKTSNTHKSQGGRNIPSEIPSKTPSSPKMKTPESKIKLNLKPAILKPPKPSDKPTKKKREKKTENKTTLKPQKNKITSMFKVETKTTCVQDKENEDNLTGNEDNSERSDEGGTKRIQYASESSSVQGDCRPLPVQIHDSMMPNISRILNQHEHPDLGENSKSKTFTIHNSLLANPKYNPDILPEKQVNADRSHCDITA